MATHWQRAIILMDMDAFFASIEQMDFPSLQNRPVAVVNSEHGSCIITCSYEARAFGIKTGMPFKLAKRLCPKIVKRVSRPKRYAELSRTIMAALQTITPDIEVFSVDEAFLDVTRCQKLYGTPEAIASRVQQLVKTVSGLNCSVGVSGDKTTAKYAAKQQKPQGLTVIKPWEAKKRLADVSVNHLCGVGEGVQRFLNRYGANVCGDVERLPIGLLAKRFGNFGRRLWYMCQGADPLPVKTVVLAPKSMGHSKVLSIYDKDHRLVKAYFREICEKLAKRLRLNQLVAQTFMVGFKTYLAGWCSVKAKLVYPDNDGKAFYDLVIKHLFYNGGYLEVIQIQIVALDPQPDGIQPDLFQSKQTKIKDTNHAIDRVNQRFGKNVLGPGSVLVKPKATEVINPSWLPSGHRDTIG